MFEEYEFLDYCEKRYLNGYCNQEEAIALQKSEGVSDAVKSVSQWQLVCWLGEYMELKSARDSAE